MMEFLKSFALIAGLIFGTALLYSWFGQSQTFKIIIGVIAIGFNVAILLAAFRPRK